eukprot:GILJ01008245.1.p1 GENE.GILJ01008245.1~~GILJ01008245.1.p1  ORF type:complete len:636 (+),score=65.69 GILJ01008245.1:75-1982(+)
MERTNPWRRKPTEAFEELAQKVTTARFFLLQELGPTSFILRDEANHKFKVSIGNQHKCSCGGGTKEHCIHTVFVLLKLLRIPSDNPLAWQLSFIEAEITQIMTQRFDRRSNPRKPKALEHESETQVKTELGRKVCRQSIEEDPTCPICQEEMLDEASLTYCKTGCGHNIHTQCMKIWADHRNSIGEGITCPLCRHDWGESAHGDLKKGAQKVEQISKHFGIHCSYCKRGPIQGSRFHCLYCANYELCGNCFDRNQHIHHPLIRKERRNGSWLPAIREVSPAMLQLAAEIQNRELSSDDYDLLLQLDAQSTVPPLHTYLASKLKLATPDSTESEDKFCSLCSNQSPDQQWVRLNCQHLFHKDCIELHMSRSEYICPIDQHPLFAGIISAFAPPPKRERVEATVEKPADSAVTGFGVMGVGIRYASPVVPLETLAIPVTYPSRPVRGQLKRPPLVRPQQPLQDVNGLEIGAHSLSLAVGSNDGYRFTSESAPSSARSLPPSGHNNGQGLRRLNSTSSVENKQRSALSFAGLEIGSGGSALNRSRPPASQRAQRLRNFTGRPTAHSPLQISGTGDISTEVSILSAEVAVIAQPLAMRAADKRSVSAGPLRRNSNVTRVASEQILSSTHRYTAGSRSQR